MDAYLSDPVAIERKSFALIRAATDLSGFDEHGQQLVLRLVHTCGNPEVAGHVRISGGAIGIGMEALGADAAVLCDVEMVRQGLDRRGLERDPLCFLNDERSAALARANRETRSMSAVSLWAPHLAGAIAVIGNAPTALFRLMEMIESGAAAAPRLIIGMPVGFVGAAEAKSYLWRHYRDLGTACITIEGRTGGSALAAAAFNTLIRLQRGVRS